MKLKEIKLTNFNNLDSTVLGYNNPPLRIANKDGHSCITNTSDNVFRGIAFTPLVKKIEFWGNQVINGYNWYSFFCIEIKVNVYGAKEDIGWILVNSNSTGIEWRPHTEVVAPVYSLNTWYHWTIYLDEDNCPWYDMKDEEGNLLYSGKLSEYPVIQFNSLSVVNPYQSDVSYLRDISVYIEDTPLPESKEFLDKEGLIKVWANIKSYTSSKIPTKTSQLQNDSNYATTSQLPSKTSQLTNDSGFTTIADTVLKTNTGYTFRNYDLNSLNIDEKDNENYAVGISVDGYGTRPVGGHTNIINFCTNHFLTQLCIPIHPNKDTDCMYIRTRWVGDPTWGEWRKSANDNSVVHKSGDETISGIKNFNDVVLGEQSGVIRLGNNGEGALFCNLYYDGGIYNNIKLFYPKTTNEYNLGTSTHKWKTLNGINPGALSLPDHNSYLDIKGNLPASVSDNLWISRYQITPEQDGILILTFNDCSAAVVWTNSDLPSYGDLGTSICIEKRVMAFVLKGVTYDIYTNNYSQIAIARLFYCQGNV